jgi:AcrR family transcriptional regulator
MAKKSSGKKLPPRDPIEAALSLAAERDWTGISFADIAERAAIPLAELEERFGSKGGILTAFSRRLDFKAVENADGGAGMSPRDRLFDLLMERFDGLNEHRGGVLSILNSTRGNPKYALSALPHLARSMARMLEAAGEKTASPLGPLRVMGLTSLYLKTLHTWSNDDSPDMSRTMAALDQNLARAEQAMSCAIFDRIRSSG